MALKTLLVALLLSTTGSCWASESEALPGLLGVVVESLLPGAAAGGLFGKLLSASAKKGPSRAQGQVSLLEADLREALVRVDAVEHDCDVERVERHRLEHRVDAVILRLPAASSTGSGEGRVAS